MRNQRRLQDFHDIWKKLYIDIGWYRYVLDERTGELVRQLTRPNWQNEYARQRAIRILVDQILQKNPRKVTAKDFISNGLATVLHYYGERPYAALKDAGYNLTPEYMARHPRIYRNQRNRTRAIRWLVTRLNKDPRDISTKDFELNGLGVVLDYHGSIYEALVAAGYQIEPWETVQTHRGYFDSPENRANAVRWLAQKLNKDVRNLTTEDFLGNRLAGLSFRYHGSPYKILRSIGIEIEPWEMHKTPMNYFASRENRIRAVKWLIEKTVKDPRNIKPNDFYSNGLTGLLRHHYGGRRYAALVEAGYSIEPWEIDRTPSGFYRDRNNRVKAINWLVTQVNKPPQQITSADFREYGLSGLISSRYYSGAYEALYDAGLVTDKYEAQMRQRHRRKNLVTSAD